MRTAFQNTFPAAPNRCVKSVTHHVVHDFVNFTLLAYSEILKSNFGIIWHRCKTSEKHHMTIINKTCVCIIGACFVLYDIPQYGSASDKLVEKILVEKNIRHPMRL